MNEDLNIEPPFLIEKENNNRSNSMNSRDGKAPRRKLKAKVRGERAQSPTSDDAPIP